MKVRYNVVYPFVLIFAVVALLAEVAHADPMALWNIITRQCVPQFEKGEALIPPCEHVDIAGGKDRGYVYFKDRIGVAQILTIPIRRLNGIEEPALLEPDTRIISRPPGPRAPTWKRVCIGLCRARRSRSRSIPWSVAARTSCTSTSIASTMMSRRRLLNTKTGSTPNGVP